MRFDGGTNVGGPQEEEWSWEADRQGSQDSATKDSGIDTSSTFTSSEDSNRGDLPKVRGRGYEQSNVSRLVRNARETLLEFVASRSRIDDGVEGEGPYDRMIDRV